MEFDLDPFDAADALLDTDQDGHDRNRNGILEEGEFFTNLMEFEIRNLADLYSNYKIRITIIYILLNL